MNTPAEIDTAITRQAPPPPAPGYAAIDPQAFNERVQRAQAWIENQNNPFPPNQQGGYYTPPDPTPPLTAQQEADYRDLFDNARRNERERLIKGLPPQDELPTTALKEIETSLKGSLPERIALASQSRISTSAGTLIGLDDNPLVRATHLRHAMSLTTTVTRAAKLDPDPIVHKAWWDRVQQKRGD